MSTFSALRRDAAVRQGNRCHYCSLPMWEGNKRSFCKSTGLTRRQASLLRATAEHLLPRSEGGPDDKENIAAACLFCNRSRHQVARPLTANEYKKLVAGRISSGQWFAGALPVQVISQLSATPRSSEA
jgi:HNH endonuclease